MALPMPQAEAGQDVEVLDPADEGSKVAFGRRLVEIVGPDDALGAAGVPQPVTRRCRVGLDLLS